MSASIPSSAITAQAHLATEPTSGTAVLCVERHAQRTNRSYKITCTFKDCPSGFRKNPWSGVMIDGARVFDNMDHVLRTIDTVFGSRKVLTDASVASAGHRSRAVDWVRRADGSMFLGNSYKLGEKSPTRSLFVSYRSGVDEGTHSEWAHKQLVFKSEADAKPLFISNIPLTLGHKESEKVLAPYVTGMRPPAMEASVLLREGPMTITQSQLQEKIRAIVFQGKTGRSTDYRNDLPMTEPWAEWLKKIDADETVHVTDIPDLLPEIPEQDRTAA